MALRALLLSPDDQAVNAITGVLEEMSVSCERPLDGVSAAKKLTSERFDLVLVDCENLPAAKLIFDVCRRSHGTAVPVAIVDGRVGLPTAFRLGAELILTKPVAKDQARITIRTAIGRTMKEAVQDAKPGDTVRNVPTQAEDERESAAPKAFAQAAASIASAADQNPSVAVATAPASEQTPAPTPAEPSAPVMSSATTQTRAPSPSHASPVPPPISASHAITASKNLSMIAPSKPTTSDGPQVSDDPVVAALENDEPTLKSPIFSAYEQPKKQRGPGLLVTTLMLALASGGVYAAWMYQPGFREFIQVRIGQVKSLLGLQSQPAGSQVRQSAPPRAKAPARQTPPPQTPVVERLQASPAAPPTPSTNNSGSATPNTVPTTTPSGAADAPMPGETQKKIAVPIVPKSDPPDASNAVVILSSKGAEKRLLQRVMPVVPAEVRAQSGEATVVLRAVVDANGSVQSVQPVEGNSALADAATKAVKQWRYKPYIRDGKALPFQTIVLVDFQ